MNLAARPDACGQGSSGRVSPSLASETHFVFGLILLYPVLTREIWGRFGGVELSVPGLAFFVLFCAFPASWFRDLRLTDHCNRPLIRPALARLSQGTGTAVLWARCLF